MKQRKPTKSTPALLTRATLDQIRGGGTTTKTKEQYLEIKLENILVTG